MAYAFDNIMNALKPQDQQSSIFGLTGDQGQQAQGGQTGTTLSSSDGEISGGSGGGSSYSPQAAPQPQTTAGARNTLMQRNRDRVTAPVDASQVTSSISAAKDKLQEEANSYVQAADDPYERAIKAAPTAARHYAETGSTNYTAQPGVSASATISANGPANEGPANDWLDLYRSSPGAVSGPDFKTNTDIDDARMLQTDSGLRELFRRRGDAEYSAGESALDTALLRGNQPFQATRDQILGSYRDLQGQKSAESQDALRQQAQDLRNKTAGTYQQGLTQQFNNILGDYEAAGRQREQDTELQLQGADAARRRGLQGEAQGVLTEMRNKGTVPPELLPYLQAGDPTSYYKSGVTDLDWRDLVSGEEASKWNRVMGVLGGGGNIMTPGQYADKDVSSLLGGQFDANAFQNDARSRADLAYRADQERLAREAQAKAAVDDDNARKAAARDELVAGRPVGPAPRPGQFAPGIDAAGLGSGSGTGDPWGLDPNQARPGQLPWQIGELLSQGRR